MARCAAGRESQASFGRSVVGKLIAFILAMALSLQMSGPAAAAPRGDNRPDGVALDPLTQTLVANAGGDDGFAAADLATTMADPATLHFGPYPSQTADSGTCGTDWANDTVDRYFTIRQIAPDTFRVYEQFRDGAFATLSGASPGACETSSAHGALVNAGIEGRFHGYDVITVTSTMYIPQSAACAPPCASTDQFLASVFGPAGAASRVDTAYSFQYVSM